ncbi:unnamed protein product [Dovyalis caffra]|uniref:NAC domain-containing protein n=1 Tax=Dovyalis caffra TaxID=77055 RepID=A0AAV1RCN1_9ROSI|nr:unnamed protein product [Dovyalis caffra]
MSSGEENSSETPPMEFSIEESKPNIQHPVAAPLASNISSNPPASPPQILSTSNSPPPVIPQPPSTIASPPPPPLPLSIVTRPPPQPSFSNKHDDNHYFRSFPPGYRFCPHDDELVLHYLSKKVRGLPLPRNRIFEVTLYQHDPEFLADRYKHYGEKVWYFFTPRDRKYKNGTRPNRAAGGGYWKATGADKHITYDKAAVGADRNATVEKVIVGFRKALVYYTGKAPRGDKTNWIMHEFRVNDPPPQVRNHRDDMRLDDWVLCRIYKKHEKRTNVSTNVRNRQRNEEDSAGSIDEDYVNGHDHNTNDHLAGMEADYAGEIYDIGTGSLDNSFAMLDDLSPQQTALSRFSDAFNFYHAPPNYCRMLHDTQLPSLPETIGSSAPMFSNINPDSWSFRQNGCQDEFLNTTNWSHRNIADQFLDPYSVRSISLPRNPAPLVNLRPTNTVSLNGSLRPINIALPNGILPPTNIASRIRSLPPMNTARPTGSLPPINTARPTGSLPPINTARPTGSLPPINTARPTGSLPPINTVLTSRLPLTNPANSQPMSSMPSTNPANNQPMSAMNAPVGYDGNSFGSSDIDGSEVHKALREKYGEEGASSSLPMFGQFGPFLFNLDEFGCAEFSNLVPWYMMEPDRSCQITLIIDI